MGELLNVRVRFQLVTPLLFPANKPIRPLSGDGLYGYAWAIEQGLFKTPAETNLNNIVMPVLPFTLVNNSFYSISSSFAAEGAFLEPTLIFRHADYTQSFARQGLGGSCISNQMGEHQAVRELYWKLVTPHLDFFAQVTDKERFVELTEQIMKLGHLGGKRSVGFGQISTVNIDLAEEWSLVKEGCPARPLPVSSWQKPLTGETIDFVGFRPPYWNQALYEHCYVSPPSFFSFPSVPNETATFAADALLEKTRSKFLEKELAKETPANCKCKLNTLVK